MQDIFFLKDQYGEEHFLIKIQQARKSACDCKEKNNLSICNMMAYNTRKVLYEKVRLIATVTDGNL